MFFEKEAFFYWLDEGLIEISLSAKTSGTWRTISSGTSAQAGEHYRHVEGTFKARNNTLEVVVLRHVGQDLELVFLFETRILTRISISDDGNIDKALEFGIEATSDDGETVQTAIVLHPFDYKD